MRRLVLVACAVFALGGVFGCCTIPRESADALSNAWRLIEADAIRGMEARLSESRPLPGESVEAHLVRVARMKDTERRHIAEFSALVEEVRTSAR